MALLRKFNAKAKTEINTGFGLNPSDYGGRFFNKSGRANMEKRGLGILEKISWYHTLLDLPVWKFFAVILGFFTVVNLFFAIVYYGFGVEHLGGMVYNSPGEKFAEAFFFSCQTFTTVGYGRINPVGILASAIASIESLIGVLSFAVVTGLLYGRFARPKAYLRFSENALLAPYEGGAAVMFRVAPYKNTTLLDAEVKVSLALSIEEDGKVVNKFYQLPLEYATVNSLTLSWTIVHPITETSPFYKLTPDDYSTLRGEILVFFKAFDDMFSNMVVSRTSYIFKEIVVGAKFAPMFYRSDDGAKTILDLNKLNAHIAAEVNYSYASEEKNTG